MARSFIAGNDAERVRLKALVTRLSDEELSRPMAAGWTIAGALAHMALWDARGLFYMNKWEGGIDPSKEDWEPEDIDWVNDSAVEFMSHCANHPPCLTRMVWEKPLSSRGFGSAVAESG